MSQARFVIRDVILREELDLYLILFALSNKNFKSSYSIHDQLTVFLLSGDIWDCVKTSKPNNIITVKY